MKEGIPSGLLGGEINGILFGDNGYACTQFLLTPLLHSLSGPETRYNRAHVKTGGVVEKLFGKLKMKFRATFN
ncbi:hypothetical protein NQ314_007855 [Rhamnusium bicolor]|uniref:DDE Tnp4 domain-containing protein n=1 Tax=Rhamnusium bicolor TaxID=1586634 RepID=A0AAV8YJ51_9CUCU|nr:hypothetical protein NQ314_007855 [Rhamnusium bicolor]